MLATIRNAALAAISTLALAPAAFAAPLPSAVYGEPQSVEVHYGDLNLASEAGAAQLARRVAIATKQVCGGADRRDLMQNRLTGICRAETLARVQPRVATAVAAARSDTGLAMGGGSSSMRVSAH